jgi:hypothetical protein
MLGAIATGMDGTVYGGRGLREQEGNVQGLHAGLSRCIDLDICILARPAIRSVQSDRFGYRSSSNAQPSLEGNIQEAESGSEAG